MMSIEREVVFKTTPAVQGVFEQYPDEVKSQMLHLRELVIETASGIPEIGLLEETLKWGEPSYLAKKGSTLRMDWKRKQPNQYALYFSCTSQLVPTFRLVFGDVFTYEGNRAIIFGLEDPIPVEELKACIRTTLQYHRVKHLPRLGL